MKAMATNRTTLSTYDPNADLLSTNNTLKIVALVGVFLFGMIAVYGTYLTWRHQRWETHLENRRRPKDTDASRPQCRIRQQSGAYSAWSYLSTLSVLS